MNERLEGFHGWVKWVVVIAALVTITNVANDFIHGLFRGWSSYSPPARLERTK